MSTKRQYHRARAPRQLDPATVRKRAYAEIKRVNGNGDLWPNAKQVGEKLLRLIIAFNGRAHPPETWLAADLGVSLSVVEHAVAAVVAAGHLHKVRGVGQGIANVYTLPRRRRTAPAHDIDEGEASMRIVPQERRPVSTVAPPGPAPSPAPSPEPAPLTASEIEAQRLAADEAKERTKLLAFLGKVSERCPALYEARREIGDMTLPQVRELARTIAALVNSGAALTPEAIRDLLECATLN